MSGAETWRLFCSVDHAEVLLDHHSCNTPSHTQTDGHKILNRTQIDVELHIEYCAFKSELSIELIEVQVAL